MPDQERFEYKDLPGFGLQIMRVSGKGKSACVGRAAGNTNHGEAGRDCQGPSLARLNYSVSIPRGQAIFYVQSQDFSDVSVFG